MSRRSGFVEEGQVDVGKVQQLSVVLPVGHPLSGRARIKLPELAGANFVDLPPGYGGRIINDAAFSAAAVPRRVALEVVDLHSASAYVREGLGVGIFPSGRIGEEPGVVARKLVGATAVAWPVAMATAAERAPRAATKALVELLADSHMDQSVKKRSSGRQLPAGSVRLTARR